MFQMKSLVTVDRVHVLNYIFVFQMMVELSA